MDCGGEIMLMALEYENMDELTSKELIKCDNCGKLHRTHAMTNNNLSSVNKARCKSCGRQQFTPVLLDNFQPLSSEYQNGGGS